MTSPDFEHVSARVEQALRDFVALRRATLLEVGPELEPLGTTIVDLLGGGKRIRPAFCYWGWRAAGGDPDRPGIFAVGAALELIQASALVHDDVMDGSDTRRGRPSAHRAFAAYHAMSGWLGAAEAFGMGAAILVGDLCLSWADELLQGSGLPAEALRRGRGVFDLMRTELMAGQYLDLLEQARGGDSVESALRVILFKSAKYTVERPLHLGAALAGGPEATIEALSAYGVPLGIAYQLRDDVLGVFGDPERTGKPAGDDLREGKRTVLVATTLAMAPPAQAATVRRLLGDPKLDDDGVAELRGVITGCGALAACERLIETYAEESLAALRSPAFDEQTRAALTHLARKASARSR